MKKSNKMYLLITIMLSAMIILTNCKSDDNEEKQFVVGAQIGDIENRTGELYFFEKYNIWGIKDRNISMDSKEFYLILNPENFIKLDSNNKDVEVSGTLYQSEIREGDFDNYYFIKVNILNYK